MNDYRDAAFLWIIFPATKCRCRAYKIYLSSCTLIFRSTMSIFSFINLHANLFFRGVSYTLSRTVFEDIWFIKLRNTWFLAVWFSGMLFAIEGIITLAGRTRVMRVTSYDDIFPFLLEIMVHAIRYLHWKQSTIRDQWDQIIFPCAHLRHTAVFTG